MNKFCFVVQFGDYFKVRDILNNAKIKFNALPDMSDKYRETIFCTFVISFYSTPDEQKLILNKIKECEIKIKII